MSYNTRNMSDELSPQKSYDERLAACPIHQWADVDDYLDRAQVPSHLRKPFHELVLSRGELPKYMNPEQGKLFGKQAVDITLRYELLPLEAYALIMMFGQLIEQWLSSDVANN